MNNLWSDEIAASVIKRYAAVGINADLALRIYTTQLLGSDSRLVLHGGGNTSVKTTAHDLLGEVEVLCVKGSGVDMATIEPRGLPAVRLAPLRQLKSRSTLTDEEMVNFQRINLLNAQAPNPSVETLLHAFLPHKYIDHTHAIAVLALTDQPNPEVVCRDVYGTRLAYVPYIMPGFTLAQRAAQIYEEHPEVEGLILIKHGIFTFGASAREAYARMITMVTLAEERLARGRRPVFVANVSFNAQLAAPAAVMPLLRGALATALNDQKWRRVIIDFRTSPVIIDYLASLDCTNYSQRGVVTPDHVLRTKNWPLLLTPPPADNLAQWAHETKIAVNNFITRYQDYFARHNANAMPARQMLDPTPNVVLIPKLGLCGIGNSKQAAAMAADIAITNIECITDAEAIGCFSPVTEQEIFAVEYWSLEQAKLGKSVERSFARQVVVVTGGGSGIGAATARAFVKEGAAVVILDRDPKATQISANACGALGYTCDVTNPHAVREAFESIVNTFGGVDIVISNAGAAWQGLIGEVEESLLRASFELNFYAHHIVARNAAQIMRAQGTGGCLLFNISKQAFNPGPGFGPYGVPKAATLALMKQYALDYGQFGIRANAVNADRIRTGLLTEEMITSRAKARGVSTHDYLAGNLLGVEVTTEDVAAAFVYLAGALKTTACVLTVDGGNIAASPR